MNRKHAENLLKLSFIAGAIVDAAALLPMLWPWAAKLMWGIDASAGPYHYAMWMGAALMLGWTLLLIWAAAKPVERKSVAPLTMVVILGIAAAEIAAVAAGVMGFNKALPSFVMQTVLLALFGTGYTFSRQPAAQAGVKQQGFYIRVDEAVLDCADEEKLASFYAGLLGWSITERGEDWLVLSGPDSPLLLLFQREEDYIPPVWPEEAGAQQKMLHLDFHVNDLDRAVQHAVSLGATVAGAQFKPERWITLLDPAGHPFCLCLEG